MTGTPMIIRAEAEHAERISTLIAEAFEPLDVVAWLVPDRAERRRRLDANFRIFVEHAFAHGHIDLTSDRAAVAVWFHVDGGEIPPPPDYDARLVAACGPFTDRFRMLDAAFDEHHPHGVAHHHLAFLAVRPGRQCGGLGTALLEAHHPRLDDTGVGAYLEASTARSRELYARHGYRLRGGPFTLPGGPPMWPMWRPPTPP